MLNKLRAGFPGRVSVLRALLRVTKSDDYQTHLTGEASCDEPSQENAEIVVAKCFERA
jgi:hypothetical protein